MALPLTRHRFSVDEYHRMAGSVFHEDDRVELIEGEIVDMPPVGGPHIRTINRLNAIFAVGLSGRAITQPQSPLRLSNHSEPQPDLVLLRPETTVYPAGPEDALLVVEVSDTTLRYDRQVKVPLYARAGIPETWVVDLNRGVIHVYRDPSPDGYQTVFAVRGEQPLSPLAFPGLILTPAQILS